MTVLAIVSATPAMIPAAMSWFGTVVPGVGTMHASAAAGGVAAVLQKIVAFFFDWFAGDKRTAIIILARFSTATITVSSLIKRE